MKYAKIIKYRNFSKTNMQKYSAALRGLNWDFLKNIDNTQLAYDQFYNIFFDLYNLHFPLLSKSLNKNVHGFHPWMTKGLLISRNRKLMLCKLSLNIPLMNQFHVTDVIVIFMPKSLKPAKNFISKNNCPNINRIVKKHGRFSERL